MSCDQLEMIRELIAAEPKALIKEPWLSHLTLCDVCKRENKSFEQSLALYKALEGTHLDGRPAPLSWKAMSQAIEKGHSKNISLKALTTYSVAATLFVSMGIGGYILSSGFSSTPPAKIVTVQPEHKKTLLEALSKSLSRQKLISPDKLKQLAVSNDAAGLEALAGRPIAGKTGADDTKPDQNKNEGEQRWVLKVPDSQTYQAGNNYPHIPTPDELILRTASRPGNSTD